jgi:mRNA interferase YafQ
MPELRYSPRYASDVSRLRLAGRELDDLFAVLEMLRDGDELPESMHDHALTGKWGGFRECHIDSDWLLVYRIDARHDTINVDRTGAHQDLF